MGKKPPVNPMQLYLQSVGKVAVIFIVLVIAIIFSQSDLRSTLFQGSIFQQGGEVLGEDAVEEGEIQISGNLKIDQFFPPRSLNLTNWKGETIEYPFFQRSRTFVPRFRLIRDLKEGWEATFTLKSEAALPEPVTHTVREKDKDGLVRTRFAQLPGGHYTLHVTLRNREGKILKNIMHNNIWILDHSVALLGDDIFNGIHQPGLEKARFDQALFARPAKVVEETHYFGLDAYIEEAYRAQGKIVFPLNLAWWGQRPGHFLDHWIEDGRKDFVFSLDGEKENESFLGVDQFWIGFFHSAEGLKVQDYLNEIEALIGELQKRGIRNENIMVIEPPFSVAVDMREHVEGLRKAVPAWGVRLGPPIYEWTRDEYGRLIALDSEPHLSELGMQRLAEWLVASDLGTDRSE